MKRTLLVFFVIFSLSLSATGGNNSPYFFTQIGVEDGLTQGTITKLYQDSDGYLWIGTQGGLHRYDGHDFKVFKNNPTDSCSLADNNVIDIGEDKDKNIWVITNNGAYKIEHLTGKGKRYHPKESRFIHCCMRCQNGDFLLAGEKYIYQYDEQADSLVFKDWLADTPINSNIKGLQEDKDGNLYVASQTTGLAVLNKQKEVVRFFQHEPNNPFSLIDGAIRGLFTDSRQRLWILSETAGACYFDKENERFVHLNTGNSALSSNVVRAMTETDSATLLLGTFDGLNRVDMQTLEVTPCKFNPDEPGALSYYSIHSLLTDNTGALWAGTWKGLNYYSPARTQFYRITPREFTGLLGMGKEDNEGNIWFATEGAGLLCYSPATQSQQFFPKKSPYKNNYNANIFKSLLIKGDSILCATNQGAVYLFSRKNKDYRLLYDFQHGDIYTLLNDSKGRLWIPTMSPTGLVMADKGKQTNLFMANGESRKFPFVTAIAETAPDVFVMGTLTQGLHQYDMQKETLKTVSSTDLGLPENVKPGTVTTILTDPSNNIWVSFFGYGIFRFDADLNLIKHYTAEDGITDTYIYSMVSGRDNSLWALSQKGLYCYNAQKDNFGTLCDEKPQVLEYTLHAGTAGSNGTLYFPGNKGILCFNPIPLQENTYIPPVYLTSLSINNSPAEFKSGEPIRLKAHETNIAIGYTAPDFIAPSQNQYAYQMEGVDNEWNYVKGRRVAYYSNLAPGSYKFKVKVANNQGRWNPQETSLGITVLPPLYKTWWAYLFYITAICAIIWKFIYHQKVRHELENNIRFKQLEQKRMQELHDERMQLFTNFSHELRTPLTLISNPLEDLLAYKGFSNEVKKDLQMMYKNTQRLLLLVNNLMDVQKYDANKMMLHKEQFTLSVFANEIYESFVPIAKHRNINFKQHFLLVGFFKVYYDRLEIEKVMFNLLSNALKFTPAKGTIELTWTILFESNKMLRDLKRRHPQLTEKDYIYIQVSDNGKGMSESEVKKVFQPFYRTSQDLHHQVAGSGIGLSLSRTIVEKHEGIIWAESSPKTGTCMHVLLPAPRIPSRSPIDPIETPLPKNMHKFIPNDKKKNAANTQTLLIVEDNKDVADYLEKQLENDYNILKAYNGREAWELIAQKKPDLVVSDIMMPEMDGLELCRRIKHDNDLAHIPVILLTAITIPSQINEGYQAGADDYVIKPFNTKLLQTRIENLLKSQKRMKLKYEKRLNLNELGVKTSSPNEKFLQQYTDIIKANFANPDLNIDIICKEIGMSHASFYRKSKMLTNLSPAKMIKLLRLEAAAQMLRDTDLSIAEILEKVSFSSSGYFASCFKEVYGMSPKEYRQAERFKE